MGDIDASLGFDVDFPADDFRDAVTFAMQMGAPPDVEMQAVFVFPSSERTYSKNGSPVSDVRLDREGNPLDPEITVVEAQPVKKKVDCAIEITEVSRNELPVGNLRPSKATVTLLDTQYAKARGCREMIYGGDRYLFSYEPETLGLFDVGVFTLIFYAIDDN